MFCGCTDQVACVKPCANNQKLACDWLTIGCCTFCFYRILEQAYLIVSNPPAEPLVELFTSYADADPRRDLASLIQQGRM